MSQRRECRAPKAKEANKTSLHRAYEPSNLTKPSTWARIAFVTFGRKDSVLEILAFDSQKGAADFAMSLDDPQRRTVQLHLPNGDVADLPAIERIYAIQK